MKRFAVVMVFVSLAAGAVLGQGLTVISPNGGESWALRSPQRITWSTTETSGFARILLFKGTANLGIIRDNVPVTAGFIDWVVGQYQGGEAAPGTDYKVRIRKLQSEVWDASNRAFSITPPAAAPGPASIRVDSPNGGETWWRDTAYEIRWTPVNVPGNVTIKLMKGGAAVQSSSVPNTGTCLWMCRGVPDGADYRVRVENADATIFDQSDRDFEVKTRAVSTPPETPGTKPPAIARSAVIKLPPRLTEFKIDDGAEMSQGLNVTFSYRCMGGGTPTHYRYKIQRDYWEDWQALLPGQKPYGNLLLDQCVANIYFQLKNEFGESNQLNDTILSGFYKTERQIGINQALDWARPKGFTAAVIYKDCEDQCAWLMQYRDGFAFMLGFDGLISKGNNLRGMKADYELFGGGKLLKPGWEFVSYEMPEFASVGNPDGPEAHGGRIKLMPAVGGRDIRLQVHLWRNFLAPDISFMVRSIRLKGPCQEHVSKAFDQE